MSISRIKTTNGYRFHGTGQADKKQNLFTVTPNLPATDVLQSVSDLLSTLEDPIYTAAMGECAHEGNYAWLVHHSLMSAKAALDAAIDGLMEAERLECESAQVEGKV
ncbi:Protein of unknown function (DUF3077) [Azomonas agilis]|uniref:DUF3077 family protein n=1 Tax=Azomonas agilis TaxID=116849 RepID=A0A562J232_9GAMM|nr:DUF3077 domain-containing protein [Azomonas agilis]TWH76895.1 Protein of unknown function (DUF3077) [Azomonas agilis]